MNMSAQPSSSCEKSCAQTKIGDFSSASHMHRHVRAIVKDVNC